MIIALHRIGESGHEIGLEGLVIALILVEGPEDRPWVWGFAEALASLHAIGGLADLGQLGNGSLGHQDLDVRQVELLFEIIPIDLVLAKTQEIHLS